MPFCDTQTLTVLLVVLFIYAMSPVDYVADKTHGHSRRHIDDILLLFLLAVAVTFIFDNCPGPRYYYY